MAIHNKILELRNKVGATPILFSHKFNKLYQPLEIRAKKSNDNSPRLLRQYFAIWGVPDDYGTIPMKGCFSKSINDRGPNSKSTYKITALYMHSQRDSVGMPIVLEEDEIGLYGEVPILEGIQVADELVIRHKSGTCNNGSYGFNYVWDKMEYDSSLDAVIMKECDLYEISFVTIGSQPGTFGTRGANGEYMDETLIDDTDDMIRKLPIRDRLELRNLIDRHISLVKNQPLEVRQKTLEDTEPKSVGIDYNYLIQQL